MLREALDWLHDRALGAMPVIKEHDQTFVRLSNGALQEIKPTTKVLPKNVRATFKAGDVDSFADYVKGYGGDGSEIFIDVDTRKVVAVLDYHGRDAPNFCEHRVEMQLRHAPEWTAWVGKHRQAIAQDAFCEFIELNMGDVVAPAAADLLDMVSLIEGKKSVQFRSGYRASDGSRRIQYEEDSNGGEMRVPNQIDIAVPVYQLGEKVAVSALLRVRPVDGKVTFRLDFKNHEQVEKDALLGIREALAQKTARPVRIGAATV